MKKIIYLLLLTTVALIFSSCNKDDDKKNPFVGTWENKEMGERITFKEDMTYTWRYEDDYDTYTEKGEYEYSDKEINFTSDDEGEYEVDYEFDGDKLIIGDGDDEIEYEKD